MNVTSYRTHKDYEKLKDEYLKILNMKSALASLYEVAANKRFDMSKSGITNPEPPTINIEEEMKSDAKQREKALKNMSTMTSKDEALKFLQDIQDFEEIKAFNTYFTIFKKDLEGLSGLDHSTLTTLWGNFRNKLMSGDRSQLLVGTQLEQFKEALQEKADKIIFLVNKALDKKDPRIQMIEKEVHDAVITNDANKIDKLYIKALTQGQVGAFPKMESEEERQERLNEEKRQEVGEDMTKFEEVSRETFDSVVKDLVDNYVENQIAEIDDELMFTVHGNRKNNLKNKLFKEAGLYDHVINETLKLQGESKDERDEVFNRIRRSRNPEKAKIEEYNKAVNFLYDPVYQTGIKPEIEPKIEPLDERRVAIRAEKTSLIKYANTYPQKVFLANLSYMNRDEIKQLFKQRVPHDGIAVWESSSGPEKYNIKTNMPSFQKQIEYILYTEGINIPKIPIKEYFIELRNSPEIQQYLQYEQEEREKEYENEAFVEHNKEQKKRTENQLQEQYYTKETNQKQLEKELQNLVYQYEAELDNIDKLRHELEVEVENPYLKLEERFIPSFDKEIESEYLDYVNKSGDILAKVDTMPDRVEDSYIRTLQKLEKLIDIENEGLEKNEVRIKGLTKKIKNANSEKRKQKLTEELHHAQQKNGERKENINKARLKYNKLQNEKDHKIQEAIDYSEDFEQNYIGKFNKLQTDLQNKAYEAELIRNKYEKLKHGAKQKLPKLPKLSIQVENQYPVQQITYTQSDEKHDEKYEDEEQEFSDDARKIALDIVRSQHSKLGRPMTNKNFYDLMDEYENEIEQAKSEGRTHDIFALEAVRNEIINLYNEGVEGRGLKKKKVSKGIRKRYKQNVPFGKYNLNMISLGAGILDVRWDCGKTIRHLPKTKISVKLEKCLRDMTLTGEVDENLYKALSKADKEILKNALQISQAKSSIIPEDDYEISNTKRNNKDINRFNILKGEIRAGNNNPEIVNEIKELLERFLVNELIDENEYAEIIKKINDT